MTINEFAELNKKYGNETVLDYKIRLCISYKDDNGEVKRVFKDFDSWHTDYSKKILTMFADDSPCERASQSARKTENRQEIIEAYHSNLDKLLCFIKEKVKRKISNKETK